MTTRCDACGTDNPTTSRFCGSCGSALGQRCPSCSAPIVRGFRFCGACGIELAGGAGTPTQTGRDGRPMANGGRLEDSRTGGPGSGPIAERRLVSILFADLVGFTALSDGRDPEDVRELLDRLLRRVPRSSPATAGRSRSSSATRSWRCGARRSPTRTTPSGPSGPPSSWSTPSRALRRRIGLRRSPPGPAWSPARRRSPSARSARGWSPATSSTRPRGSSRPPARDGPRRRGDLRALRGAIAFEPAGDRTLRGKACPSRPGRPPGRGLTRRARPERPASRRPFVGRDDALRLAQGPPPRRAASERGAAGVDPRPGRHRQEPARLGAREVRRRRRRAVHWHQAPVARPTARARLLGARRDGPAARRHRRGRPAPTCPTRSSPRWPRTTAHPGRAERRWIEPHLAALLGLARRPAATCRGASSPGGRFFERIADTGTTVLVFDDLHWADGGLLDFIEGLVRRHRPPDPRRDAGPARAPGGASRLGYRTAQLRRPSSRSVAA